jgi:hypothetical protein
MEKNVGGIDQKIRFILGVALLAGGALAPLDLYLRIGLLVVGLVALITAFTGL